MHYVTIFLARTPFLHTFFFISFCTISGKETTAYKKTMASSISVGSVCGHMNSILKRKDFKFFLAAVKGLRNGVVYGARIRFPHALVMTFLFGKGTLVTKLRLILKLTRMHSTVLAKFAFSYKLLTSLMEKLHKSRFQWHSMVVAAFVGYFVFGDYNSVNMQINLYLLSRILVGLARLAREKGYVKG